MLKGEKFDAFALMLPIKSCFAYYQMYFCLLSNIALLTNKYSQI